MSQRNQALRSAVGHLTASRFAQAAELCRPLLAGDPADSDARFLLGLAEGALGREDEAIGHLTAVVGARPDHLDAHRELALLLQARGRPREAEAAFRAALRSAPQDVGALCAYGRLLFAENRAEEAIAQAEAALAIQPNLPEAHNLLGVALAGLGRMEPAIAHLSRAAADPADHAALANLGTALATEGRFVESLAAFAAALAAAPGDVTIRLNRAMAMLKSGRLREGWNEYEWRLKKPGREKLPPHLLLPKLAQPGIAGRTIVVYHEEGFGDTIQFLRYIPMLARAGARIVVWMPDELARLVRPLPGVDTVLTGNVSLPPFDFHCPIISLPRVFDTVLETIPADIPYLRADPQLSRSWAQRLPPAPGRRIGLVWSGEPRPYDPAALALDRRRSLKLAALAPFAGIANTAFVSLQTGAAAAEAAAPPPGMILHDPMGGVRDFADTAAIIDNLDLVVSVDTAVAHLAGAMGKPVLLLDRYDNCWRWLAGRTDSPWYPTMRIFRQEQPGAWAPAIGAAADAILAFAA